MTFRERVEDDSVNTNLDDEKWWKEGGLNWLLESLELDFGEKSDCENRIALAIILRNFSAADEEQKIKLLKSILTPVLDTHY